MTTSTKGLLFILSAGFCWGISGTIAQFLFTQNIQVMQVVQTRATFAFVILAISLLFFKRKSLTFKKEKSFGWILAGIIGVAGANYTYYSTIKLSSVGTAILIQYTAPALVMIYSVIRKEETVTGLKILALVISLIGCFFAIGTGTDALFEAGWLAVVVGFSSALCYASMAIIGRYFSKDQNPDLLQNLVFTLMFASIFWCFFDPPTNWGNWNLTAMEWSSLVAFSLVSVLFPYIFFFLGLKYLSSSTVMIIQTFEPVSAIVTAWIFLDETMGGLQLLGTTLVIGAIVMLAMSSKTLSTKKHEVNAKNH